MNPLVPRHRGAAQAAGLAALLWARYPHWTAAQVRDELRQTAEDLCTPGHDKETGYGLIRLRQPTRSAAS